jgi:hypothetical protein
MATQLGTYFLRTEFGLRTSTNHLDEHRSHGARVPYFSRECDAACVHTFAGSQTKVKAKAIDGSHRCFVWSFVCIPSRDASEGVAIRVQSDRYVTAHQCWTGFECVRR